MRSESELFAAECGEIGARRFGLSGGELVPIREHYSPNLNPTSLAPLSRRGPSAAEKACVAPRDVGPERACRDPKDGELCLSRAKSGETLMEARSGTDVQIVRQTLA